MKEIQEELTARAQEIGFQKIAVIKPARCDRWALDAAARPSVRWAKLKADPREILPGCRAMVALTMPYAPFCRERAEATIDAYYPASNRAHEGAVALAHWLEAKGFCAVGSPLLPVKPFFSETGLGRYGNNGLISVEPWGTRAILQLVLTDAPLRAVEATEEAGKWAQACAGCNLCAAVCPTGALSGDGRVDLDKCLRAQEEGQPMKETYRPLIGASLLGCDLCQRVCPRNSEQKIQPMPEQLRAALRLERLLAGDVRDLAPWIGGNYARVKRLEARACLVAANLKRHDLLESLLPLTQDAFPAVREHALWAVRQLT